MGRSTQLTSETRKLPSDVLSLSLCRPSIGDRMIVPARRIPDVLLETLVVDAELKPFSANEVISFG